LNRKFKRKAKSLLL